jgi:hypothetical protein
MEKSWEKGGEKVRKLVILVVVGVLLLTLGVSPVFAAKGDNPANDNPNNLYLYEKDANWDIVWDGTWGKMSFKLADSNINFVFNGHGLEKNTEYTLISYNDPWPGSPVCLASGTSNRGGNINLKGSADLGKSSDIKIWLVLSSDVDCDTPAMTGWNPTEYLFEHNLIP